MAYDYRAKMPNPLNIWSCRWVQDVVRKEARQVRTALVGVTQYAKDLESDDPEERLRMLRKIHKQFSDAARHCEKALAEFDPEFTERDLTDYLALPPGTEGLR